LREPNMKNPESAAEREPRATSPYPVATLEVRSVPATAPLIESDEIPVATPDETAVN